MNTKEKIRLLEEQLANQEAKLKQSGLDLVKGFTPDSFMPSLPSLGKLKNLKNSKFFKDDTVKFVLKLALGFVIARVVLGKNKSLSKPIYSVGNFLAANFKPSHALKVANIVTEFTSSIFSKKKKNKKKITEKSNDEKILDLETQPINLKSDKD
jgi:hypothetical protein